MENANRPVTGYPAPNPNPNPNPNGYSAHQPAPVTAYPYPAAATPPNPYYGYQSNSYNQLDPTTLRRAALLRRILAFAIGLLIVFASIIFIAWLVLRPQVPQFQVDSFSLSNFTISNGSLIYFAADARMTARNPNKKLTLSYDRVDTGVYYRSSSLAHTAMPPFTVDTKSQIPLTANFASVGNFIEQVAVDGINRERSSNGNLRFNLRMLSVVRFKAKAWRTRNSFLKVFCGDLVVGIPRNERPGSLTGGPRGCQVEI